MIEYKIRNYYLWFGKEHDITDDMSDNEKKIAGYNREMGNRFFIPKGIGEYFREKGAGTKWKEIYEKIMNILIYESYNLQRERTKKHAKLTEAKKHKWNLIDDNFNSDKIIYTLPKRMKYNSIIDLRGDIPKIITDKTIAKPKYINNKDIIDLTGRTTSTTTTKRKKVTKTEKKKEKKIIITGKIPTKKVKNK